MQSPRTDETSIDPWKAYASEASTSTPITEEIPVMVPLTSNLPVRQKPGWSPFFFTMFFVLVVAGLWLGYQKLPESNVVGSATTETSAPSGEACGPLVDDVVVGDTGPEVLCIEEALLSLGYFPGEADGTFDLSTEAAVKKLQEDTNHTPDGQVGPATAPELGLTFEG